MDTRTGCASAQVAIIVNRQNANTTLLGSQAAQRGCLGQPWTSTAGVHSMGFGLKHCCRWMNLTLQHTAGSQCRAVCGADRSQLDCLLWDWARRPSRRFDELHLHR